MTNPKKTELFIGGGEPTGAVILSMPNFEQRGEGRIATFAKFWLGLSKTEFDRLNSLLVGGHGKHIAIGLSDGTGHPSVAKNGCPAAIQNGYRSWIMSRGVVTKIVRNKRAPSEFEIGADVTITFTALARFHFKV